MPAMIRMADPFELTKKSSLTGYASCISVCAQAKWMAQSSSPGMPVLPGYLAVDRSHGVIVERFRACSILLGLGNLVLEHFDELWETIALEDGAILNSLQCKIADTVGQDVDNTPAVFSLPQDVVETDRLAA